MEEACSSKKVQLKIPFKLPIKRSKRHETLSVQSIQTIPQDEMNTSALDEINQSPVVDTNAMPLDCIIPADQIIPDYEITRTRSSKAYVV